MNRRSVIVSAGLLMVLSIALMTGLLRHLTQSDLVQIQPIADIAVVASGDEPPMTAEPVPVATTTTTSGEPESTSDVLNRIEPELDSQAIASFRDSIKNGDPRAPALNQSRQRDEEPTAAQLEDPQLYEQFERRQQMRVYRAYVEASKSKVAELETMIERGQREGVDEEQIEFARAKIKGIQEMAEELKRDYPDIMESSYAPADDWLTNNLGVEDPQTIENTN